MISGIAGHGDLVLVRLMVLRWQSRPVGRCGSRCYLARAAGCQERRRLARWLGAVGSLTACQRGRPVLMGAWVGWRLAISWRGVVGAHRLGGAKDRWLLFRVRGAAEGPG